MANDHRRYKDGVYAEIARFGKALSAPKRIELLELLSQGPRTVEALAGHASLSIANASQHLQILRAARLVDAARRGLFSEYRLADPGVAMFLVALHGLAATQRPELAEATHRHFRQRGALEPVAGNELLRRMKSREVVVLDVRPVEEYAAGHLPGALSMPLPELRRRPTELPRDREIVAYCRGPYCVMAVDAAALLRRHGYRALHSDDGVNEWRARGWRIVPGTALTRR